MFPGPTELRLTGCLTESIWAVHFSSGMWTPGINSQTFWLKDTSHVMNGTTFCFCSISAFSALKAALKPWWRDHTTGGDYEERVVAKSKPVRNLVTRRRTGSSTVPSSTASSSPVNFVPKDHEVRFKESAERSGAQNKETSTSDEMEDSQVRYEDENSMTRADVPVELGSDQTLNSEECKLIPVTEGTGRPVTERS